MTTAAQFRRDLRASYDQHLSRQAINAQVSKVAANPDLERWRELRRTLPAGSQTREMQALRARLLSSGLFEEVYR